VPDLVPSRNSKVAINKDSRFSIFDLATAMARQSGILFRCRIGRVTENRKSIGVDRFEAKL